MRRNRCFTTHTYITPLMGSCGLCQKPRPVLLHISALDLGGCQTRPWGCPVHSSVCSPTLLSACLKGEHWCVSIMQPLPARCWDRSIKGNTTARFTRFQKLRSDSVTLRHWERHIYRKADFNCANLKMSLVVMDWVSSGKNCHLLPHHIPCLSISVGTKCLCRGGLILTLPLTHSPLISQHKPCKWVSCCFAVPWRVHCSATEHPSLGERHFVAKSQLLGQWDAAALP